MKKQIKFKITFWKDIPERTFVIDETNFFPRYFMGLDGVLYENYGTDDKHMWESVFDADYEVEIIKQNNNKNGRRSFWSLKRRNE